MEQRQNLAMVDRMATELQLSAVLGDNHTVQDFLDCAGMPPGARLPKHDDLIEIISELRPCVRRELRRQLIGGVL